jgi:hypothetical protein
MQKVRFGTFFSAPALPILCDIHQRFTACTSTNAFNESLTSQFLLLEHNAATLLSSDAHLYGSVF